MLRVVILQAMEMEMGQVSIVYLQGRLVPSVFSFLLTCFRVTFGLSNLLVVDGNRVGVVVGVMSDE